MALRPAEQDAQLTARLYHGIEPCEEPRALCAVKVFLEDYQSAVRMLRICRLEEKARRGSEDGTVYYGEVGGTADEWLRRMHSIENFIKSLPHMPSKMLLYYHYIYGDTVERAAEDLDISRRHAFRLKKRALSLAAACYPRWLAYERAANQAKITE